MLYNGKKYKLVDSEDYDFCSGCAFYTKEKCLIEDVDALPYCGIQIFKEVKSK